MNRIIPCLLFLCLLAGCWDSQELDEAALIHGIALNKEHKDDDEIIIGVEIIKPNPSITEAGAGGGESIILQGTAESIIEGARQSIRHTKRRLYFDQNKLWVIGSELAKDDVLGHLDSIRRDQMFRLNSYLFVTEEEDPIEILKTSTLYDDLTSTAITSGLDQVQYIPGFTPLKLYEFFRMIEGPIENAFIPMIKIRQQSQHKITSLEGTAVIKNGKMIGKLDVIETIALNIFHNKADGGYIGVDVDGDKVSIEVNDTVTKVTPTLDGDNVKADIDVKIYATIAENRSRQDVTEDWLEKVGKIASKESQYYLRRTLEKLQKEFKTDITRIGIETYRKYPKEWRKIKDWDELFSTAEVNINVDVDVYHQGLIQKNIERNRERPQNNPFQFNRDH